MADGMAVAGETGALVIGVLKGVSYVKWESSDKSAHGETLCLIVETALRDVFVHISKVRESAVRDEYRGQTGKRVAVPISSDKFWIAGPGRLVEAL